MDKYYICADLNRREKRLRKSASLLLRSTLAA